MQTTASSYPATLTFDPPEKVANWRPLLNGIMAIPHFFVAGALYGVAEVVAVIGWFAILFTGKMPEGLANFQTMYLRYSMRVNTFALWMREEYPPFSFAATAADPGDDPRLRVDFQPALTGRNRLTTFFRIFLAIPHLIVVAVVAVGAVFVLIVAWFAVLFTGKWPAGMRNFVLGVLRWSLRLQAYMLLLTDRYPPFSLA